MFFTAVNLLACALIVLGLYWYLTYNFNYWKVRNVPYKRPLPVFGNMLDILRGRVSTTQYLTELYNKFKGPYYGIFSMDGKPFLVLKDPKIIKRILIKDFHSFPNRYFYNNEKIDPIIANVLFGIKTPTWQSLRARLSPLFSIRKIKTMLPLMMECAENMRKYLETNTKTNVGTKELAAKYSTDVISSCCFGIKVNCFIKDDEPFRVAGRNLFRTTFARYVQPLAYVFAHGLVKLFHLKFIDVEAASFLRAVFNKTIEGREISKIKRNDLIDTLIELKNEETKVGEFKFDGDRLVAQAIIFFAAGHETTSSAIALSLYELALNQDIQNKLRIDIHDTIAQYGELTYEVLHSIKYLQMVVSETLRKYTLAPFLQRHCEEDYVIEETGLVIERGVVVLIPTEGLQLDAKYFPDPQKYDPERFSDENKAKLTPCSYLPFGNGPRACIGEWFGLQNVKLGLLSIIKDFIVEPNALTQIPLKYQRAFFLHVVGGIPLTYRKIENQNRF